MKKITSLAVGLAAVIASPASAVILASDNFDYPDGDLVPNGGWTGYGSDQSGPLAVSGGQAVVRSSPANLVQDVVLSITPASGTLYYGITFTVADLGAPYTLDGNPDFEYFAVFYDGTGGDNLSARLDIMAPTGGGDFSVGIASDQGTADAIWATDLSYDTAYRAVVSYDQTNNLAVLWIDATLQNDTSILGENRLATEGVPGDTISGFGLRQASSDENEMVFVDDLIVGTTFNDVVSPVPDEVVAPIQVTTTRVEAGSLVIEFTNNPGATDFTILGSPDLADADPQNLNEFAVVSEISEGLFRAVVDISAMDPRMFFWISR